ncbi:glycosyltransferase [Prevotella sp.]|uniref:glycosyltransferase n=1 Tax=Prevotella sp. TaxID=59823 RepID=UPI004024A8C1
MKRKIIFFIPSGCGGAERQAIAISRCLRDDMFDVSYHIFGPVNQLEKFLPQSRKAFFHQEPKFTHNLIKNMRKVIKREKPDAVYGAGMPVNWRLVLAAAFCKCKIVLRNENYIYTQSWMQKLRLGITYRFADYVIAQTDEMNIGLVKELMLSETLVHTIPNVIDKWYITKCLEASSPFNNNKHVRFVAVGRYHIDKGFDMLVRAFAQVKAHIPNAELYVVGAYDENNEVYRNVRQFVEDEHLEDCVFCVGFKENPYIYMRYADCFVLSSRNEGLPNVMIEALYLGTPVAAMKCIPVIQRIVAECKNGYLASAGNVTELAEAMNKASKLGRIQTTYNQNSEKKFEEVFLKI